MSLSRRDFVKTAGGLLISFSMSDVLMASPQSAIPQSGTAATPLPGKLDAWLHIDNDGTVRVFTGKVDIGMGMTIALTQIVAEELDVAPERVVMVMGDTSLTPDQGGVGGSTSISGGAKPLRNVAASARALLVQMASGRLNAPVEQLQVRNGVVSLKSDTSRSISYGELARTAGLHEDLKVSGAANSLDVLGSGKPKDPSAYTVVGQPLPRLDISQKVLGKFQYVTDIRMPGMLHGRVIRPAGVGSKLAGVDDAPARQIAGFVKTVVKGDFVGVVAESEWAAVKAAKTVKVTWSVPAQAFPEQKSLYDYMRSVKPKASRETLKKGDATAAMAAAAKKIEAVYEYPFHSHATMGPGCAVADVQPSGVTTVWSGGQKPHALQKGYAQMLAVAPDKVRVIWFSDSGSYGRPGFEDVGADAVMLSQAVGRPVRVQWMRADMTSWGPKGPACLFEMSAGLDTKGSVSALKFTSRVFSGGEINFLPADAGNYLASQLAGTPNTSGVDEFANWGGNAPGYVFDNIYADAHVVPSFHEAPSPLAGTHLRDPNGPSTSFAVESFMDELAVTAGLDPIQFRLKYLDQPRASAVLTAAAGKFGWDSRPSPRKDAGKGDLVKGRGVALGIRGGTMVGTIAEVEVNRKSGDVRVTRVVVSHDCGLIINPRGLTSTIQANIVQSMSRSIKEEVKFDRSNVTSVDWLTYPVAKASDVPPIEVVLINHPEIAPTGAGEPSSRPTAAAIANAIFDATGVRLRQVPFTPTRVKAAL